MRFPFIYPSIRQQSRATTAATRLPNHYPLATQLPNYRPVAFRIYLTADLALSWIEIIFLSVTEPIIAKQVSPVYLNTEFNYNWKLATGKGYMRLR